MAYFLPPVGFHFRVDFLGLSAGDDVRFTEVRGLSMELGSEEVPEGGENRFVQKYPVRTRFPELVLKRGLLKNSLVWAWMHECLVEYKITTRTLDIMLLNENHLPLMVWHVVGAWPTKWAISDLNANSNSYMVETLQLAYQYFTVDKLL